MSKRIQDLIECELQRLGVDPLSYSYLEILSNAYSAAVWLTHPQLVDYVRDMVSMLGVEEFDKID